MTSDRAALPLLSRPPKACSAWGILGKGGSALTQASDNQIGPLGRASPRSSPDKERLQVMQWCGQRWAAYQCLDHVWPLQPQALDGLEDIQNPLCFHPFQDCAQGTEGSRPSCPCTVIKETYSTHQPSVLMRQVDDGNERIMALEVGAGGPTAPHHIKPLGSHSSGEAGAHLLPFLHGPLCLARV